MLTAPAIGLIEQTGSTSDTAPDTRKPTINEQRRPTYHQHKSAEYVLPNDSPEHQRLETQAIHLSAMMNHRVLHAPIQDAKDKRMLDIGCGTGIITDLISSTYPRASCIGLDLSPVPNIRPRRSNTHFFQGNFTSSQPSSWIPNTRAPPLPNDPELFDYIFSRLLILGMTDWPSFIKKEFSLLKPGGWAEVHDLEWHWYDAEDNVISHEWNWLQRLGEVCEREKGMDLHCGAKAKQWMQEAGFVDVQTFEYYWPWGGEAEVTPEMREVGMYSARDVPVMLHHMIERAMGERASEEEVEQMRREMRETLRAEKGKHQVFFVTIGRKPE